VSNARRGRKDFPPPHRPSRVTPHLFYSSGAAHRHRRDRTERSSPRRGRHPWYHHWSGQRPIEGANVTATSVQGGVNRVQRTDKAGRFTITFPGAEGDYFVYVTALGFTPRRFEVKRTADQEILIADARLAKMVVLDTMRATAERGRANRNDKPGDVSAPSRL